MRAALGEPSEFGAARSILVLIATTLIVFLLTAVVFDPEQRFVSRRRPIRG
jgi:hypothetical protein